MGRGLVDLWRAIAWLRDGHARELLDAGATSAEILRLEGEEIRCEVHYRFPSRAAFETYEREHAPRLRAEGLERFPPALGLRYARRSGELQSAAPGATERA